MWGALDPTLGQTRHASCPCTGQLQRETNKRKKKRKKFRNAEMLEICSASSCNQTMLLQLNNANRNSTQPQPTARASDRRLGLPCPAYCYPPPTRMLTWSNSIKPSSCLLNNAAHCTAFHTSCSDSLSGSVCMVPLTQESVSWLMLWR